MYEPILHLFFMNATVLLFLQNEFLICGSDGLVAFASVDGKSNRAPISTNMRIDDLLVKDSTICVVGDEKIALYRFVVLCSFVFVLFVCLQLKRCAGFCSAMRFGAICMQLT